MRFFIKFLAVMMISSVLVHSASLSFEGEQLDLGDYLIPVPELLRADFKVNLDSTQVITASYDSSSNSYLQMDGFTRERLEPIEVQESWIFKTITIQESSNSPLALFGDIHLELPKVVGLPHEQRTDHFKVSISKVAGGYMTSNGYNFSHCISLKTTDLMDYNESEAIYCYGFGPVEVKWNGRVKSNVVGWKFKDVI